jgi:ketosteroid isomerase-like protein
MAAPANDQTTDEKILRQLNDDHIHADQNGDVARYEEFLAEDFTAILPDLIFRNRRELLDLIARPRPFTDLTLRDVRVRILGEVALLHGRAGACVGAAPGAAGERPDGTVVCLVSYAPLPEGWKILRRCNARNSYPTG